MTTETFSVAAFSAYHDLFPKEIAALDEWQRDAQARRDRCQDAFMTLSIGVMGQMKAGKSSFLNQLLFNGSPLLPKAATPKTAALTRIRHGETPYFSARFFDPAAWAQMERLAASDAQDSIAQTAREMVEQARHSLGADIAHWLAQREVRIPASSIDELLGKMDDYVGAEGRFAAMVENSTLVLPLPELRDIEIVDTPGMNDPVASRTDRTREYMSRCDVVFLLSHASRFLDEHDQTLLAAQLPGKGVKRLVLVAAQFDSALLDDGDDRATLAETEANVTRRLTALAKRNLARLAAQREKLGYPEVARLLHSVDAPIFVSSYAEAFAHLPPAQWDEDLRTIHQRFTEMAEDAWSGAVPRQEDWRRIGNFAALRQELAQARAEKDAILAEQRASVEQDLRRSLDTLLENLSGQAHARIEFLRAHELADIEAHRAKAQKRVTAIAQTLSAYVLGKANEARAKSRDQKSQLREAASRATALQERTGYEKHRHRIKVSDSVWYKPWTWGSSHTEYYTETTSYQYLALPDAQEKLRLYFDEATDWLREQFAALIAPDRLSAGLRSELLAVLDTRSDDFDPHSLRALIEGTLARMDWPELDIEPPDVSTALAGFPLKVQDAGEVELLRQRQHEIVREMQQTLAETLDRAVTHSCAQLDALASQLHEALTQSLNEEIERRRQALTEKEAEIARLEDLLETIDNAR